MISNSPPLTTRVKDAPKLPHLDFLRGVAIFMVFAIHLYGATYWFTEFKWRGWFHDPASAFHKSMLIFYPYTLGFLGVTLFFVLSGYCIHLSFLNYAARSGGTVRLPEFLRIFYIRRFFRIYPAYLVALLFFLVAGGYFGKAHGWFHLTTHLLFLHNFWAETFSSVNGAFWSLAFEWQLYCLYPLMLLLRRHTGVGGMLAWVVAFAVGYDILANYVFADWFGLRSAVFQSRYLFPWTLGVYLCEKHQGSRKVFPRSGMLLAGAIVLAVAASEFLPTRRFIWQIFAVVFAWLIEWCDGKSFERWWARGFMLLGVVSYSFYLIHGVLIEWIIHSPVKKLLGVGYPYNQMTAGGLVVVFLPILLLSCLLYWLVEKPFHELGLRISRGGARSWYNPKTWFIRPAPVSGAKA